MLTSIFLTAAILATDPKEEPMIVAHRGASRDALENTIAAFELAWNQGADAIEGDFWLTSDGHIVCFHDSDAKRLTDIEQVVSQSTLAELRALDIGLKRGAAFKGTQIPTLEEVLATIPKGKKIYIEIKCGSEIIPVLIEALAASGLQPEQVVAICFNATVLEALKARAPEYAVSWLCSFKEEKSGEITPTQEHVLETLAKIKADGLSSNVHIPETVVKSVKEHGYAWHVWTVNDLAQAKRARQLGSTSITTDVPQVIRKGLDAL
jgi:glycerophosphoryl diester phosphodiesterase